MSEDNIDGDAWRRTGVFTFDGVIYCAIVQCGFVFVQPH